MWPLHLLFMCFVLQMIQIIQSKYKQITQSDAAFVGATSIYWSCVTYMTCKNYSDKSKSSAKKNYFHLQLSVTIKVTLLSLWMIWFLHKASNIHLK